MISYSYIYDKDTYYFPHKEIYLHRSLFIFADEYYLAAKLGLELIPRASFNTWLWKMAVAPSDGQEGALYTHCFDK